MLTRLISALILTVVATLALSACDRPQQPPAIENAEIRNVTENAAPALTNGGESEEQANTASPNTSPANEAGLPTAFLGRWGMTEADCDVGRSDTKGLVTVSGDTLKFYESLGKLMSMKTVSPMEVNASFAFSGEGQNWNKDMTLKLENGGTTLVRIEKDPAATFRHKKC
ncbi:MAG: hypothetical protein QHC67_04705 [Sphingobium sp.]|uniref:hypothetical protein n=1 Tax=Sphingobium sp. TaxID=1912891 RepID=UPI0029A1A5AB|nr:hypothetical protein [Sphingobium sp.]MDX3909101.1 hypothetical protein [Sphingobium sp.]